MKAKIQKENRVDLKSIGHETMNDTKRKGINSDKTETRRDLDTTAQVGKVNVKKRFAVLNEKVIQLMIFKEFMQSQKKLSDASNCLAAVEVSHRLNDVKNTLFGRLSHESLVFKYQDLVKSHKKEEILQNFKGYLHEKLVKIIETYSNFFCEINTKQPLDDDEDLLTNDDLGSQIIYIIQAVKESRKRRNQIIFTERQASENQTQTNLLSSSEILLKTAENLKQLTKLFCVKIPQFYNRHTEILKDVSQNLTARSQLAEQIIKNKLMYTKENTTLLHKIKNKLQRRTEKLRAKLQFIRQRKAILADLVKKNPEVQLKLDQIADLQRTLGVFKKARK